MMLQAQVIRIFRGHHRDGLNVCLFLLRCLGFWSNIDYTSTLKRRIYFIYRILVILFLCSFLGAICADLLSNLQDLIVITNDCAYVVAMSVVVCKHISFCVHRQKIIKVIHDIYDIIDNLAKSSDDGAVMLVRLYTSYDQAHYMSMVSLSAFIVVCLITINPSEPGKLPIRAKYPFDSSIGPMHKLITAIEGATVALGIGGMLAMDVMSNSLCRFITLQLEFLESNYRHCQTKWCRSAIQSSIDSRLINRTTDIRCFIPFHPHEAQEPNDSFVKRLKVCISHHERIIKIINNMNMIFGSFMFSQLCSSALMICFAGFQAALGARDQATLIKFAFFCTSALVELLITCFVGSMLLHRSMKLSNGLWESGWEEEPYSDFGYLLIFSLLRGNKTLEIKAINMYAITVETFLGILRMSYSFFALLAAVM